MYDCKIMARKYLGFGHERLNKNRAKLFMRAKTSVAKNPSNAVTEVLNLPRPFNIVHYPEDAQMRIT